MNEFLSRPIHCYICKQSTEAYKWIQFDTVHAQQRNKSDELKIWKTRLIACPTCGTVKIEIEGDGI